MLRLFSSKKQLLKKWVFSGASPLIQHQNFVINAVFHQSNIIDWCENEKGVCVFYGFLDQDTNDLSNAAFVAERLQANGFDSLAEFYGSFIIIYFCKKIQQYVLVNDALGDFAVHYHQTGNGIDVSDFPSALLNKNNCAINEDRLIRYFALSQSANTACFYKDVKQLNPGQYLVSDGKIIKHHTYYQLPTKLNRKLKSLPEIAQQFSSVMQLAIANQTRGQKKVGLMMSGGLDSTFVATNTKALKMPLKSFSYIFPQMPEADESRWIDAMRSVNKDMHTFVGHAHWPLKDPWFVSLNAPISNPYRHLKSVIYQKAQSENLSVLLTGVFADHLYTGYIYWLVDQMKYKPLMAIKSMLNMLRTDGFWVTARQLAPAKWSKKVTTKAPWLSKDASLALKQQRALPQYDPQYDHPHPQQYALASGLSTAQSCWLENEYGFKYGINVRHPFRDRRVVEWLLSLPAWLLGDNNEPKRMVRHVAKNQLPESIIRRKTITTLKPLFIKGVMQESLLQVTTLLKDTGSSWHHYIDKKTIHHMLDNPNGDHKDWQYMILWQCLSYELWKRRIAELK